MKATLLFNSEKELAFRLMLETTKHDSRAADQTKAKMKEVGQQISTLKDVSQYYEVID